MDINALPAVTIAVIRHTRLLIKIVPCVSPLKRGALNLLISKASYVTKLNTARAVSTEIFGETVSLKRLTTACSLISQRPNAKSALIKRMPTWVEVFGIMDTRLMRLNALIMLQLDSPIAGNTELGILHVEAAILVTFSMQQVNVLKQF